MPPIPPLLDLPLELLYTILDFYSDMTDLHAFAQLLHYADLDKRKGRFDYLETTTGTPSPLPRVCRPLRQHFLTYLHPRLRLHLKLPASGSFAAPAARRHEGLLREIIPKDFAAHVRILHVQYDKSLFPMELREVFPRLRVLEVECAALRMYGPGRRLENLESVRRWLDGRRVVEPGSDDGSGSGEEEGEERVRYVRRYRIVLVGRAGMFVLQGARRGRRMWSWDWVAYKEGKVIKIDWMPTEEWDELKRRKTAGEKVQLVYSDVPR